ncbi:MAG TPA: heparinase II/III family protein [Phycisphaerae bacterium]|nr:heparinase II/III family protein [Phycisphaerae bacterium]
MRHVAALMICLLSAEVSAETPKVRPGHPRIYVTAEAMPALRAKCAGPMKDVFAAMRKADWIMKRKAGTDWSDCTNVAYPAFLHLVTGEKKYLAKTKEFLDALAARPPRNQYLTPEWIRAGCTAADWVWDDLSAAERGRYGRALLDMAEWVLKNVWRHSDFNNHFVSEHLSVLYVAVLLDGERIDPARVAKLMYVGKAYLLDHAVPAANEIAGQLMRLWKDIPFLSAYRAEPPPGQRAGVFFVGGQAEGFSYNDWGYARPLALTCEMWRVATGQDVFADSSFFRGQSVWHAYALRPDTNTFARSEDCPSGFGPGEDLKAFMHLLAGRLNDPLAEWLAGRVKWKYVQKGWTEILFRDPKLIARSPKEMGLPPAACFAKLGHAYFRSAWGDERAAFALFQCGPFYAGHQHLDNNTFVIHRGGSLAVDSGTNDYGNHRGNYYARTVAHNGVLVFDPDEKFSAAAWSGKDAAGSNDGGQMRGALVTSRAGRFRPGGPADTGRIIAFANGRFCAGCAGDATRSYSPRKVRRAVRAFFHLRPEKTGPESTDTFVVFDRVETTRPELERKWILHSIERPAVHGARFLIAHGRGRLAGQVIVPQDPKIKLVGGPGKESFVDGKDYPPTQKKRDPEHGSWRVEVPIPSQSLVVLHAQMKQGPPPPDLKIERIDGATAVRVPSGDLEYRILLDKTPGALPHIEVRRGQTLLETLVLAPMKSPT